MGRWIRVGGSEEMSEGNPSIWRREDEFKDTEIGGIPKENGCIPRRKSCDN